MPQLDPVRIGTILKLHDLLERSDRSTRRMDLLETALNLALGTKRAAVSEPTLLRNVLSDARRTINRSECAAREAARMRPLPDAIHRRVAYVEEDGSPCVELISHDTPESRAILSETLRELAAFAASLGSHGPRCLDGLLRDQTVVQTAALVGVSIATVERTWKALRAQLRMLIAAAA